MMKLELINNWTRKAPWNNLFDIAYISDIWGHRHILIGALGFFIFITWGRMKCL